MDAASGVKVLRRELEAVADAQLAPAMKAYMKDHFEFLGVPAPQRRVAQRAALHAWKPSQAELTKFAQSCWCHAEREFQYAANDAISRMIRQCDSSFIEVLHELVTTKSWWDTVDGIAPNVGVLVLAHPDLVTTMDAWIDDDNMWLRRIALLHQLRYKSSTNPTRLFDYCERRASETEFFIRKAIGWALREYAKTDADAVRGFVDRNGATLSGLSQREALKNL